VDDESAVRDFLTVLLQSRGYGVRTASGAGEALDLFEREGPLIRLLLTDVLMPDVTGPALVSRVLALRPTLPVLYMSGFPGEVPLAGPFPCLKKPFAVAELIDHIDQSLAC
jgi:DNA-binding NtrC family response regulator